MIWIFLLFAVLPIAELYVLLEVGAWLGLYRTIGLIIITAIVGAATWKAQGLIVLEKIRDRLAHEEMPGDELIEGLFVLAGGLFLVTPGFITDITGFACLIPLTRKQLVGLVKKWLAKQIRTGRIQVFVSRFDDPF